MQANVIGRVRNTHLPVTQGLLPLFEAIINSIDSIEDSERELENGSIDIVILRHSTLDLPKDGGEDQPVDSPIYGFEIHDNGIGFTERNFSAFNTADTLVYTVEKTLRENKDKISDDLNTEVDEKVKAVRDALTAQDVDAVKQATQDLNTIMQKIGEAV